MNMDKLAGAMAPAKGMATRDSEKVLAKMPPGGHPTNDSGRVKVGGSVGNSAGLGDAVKHLRHHHSDTKGAYQVGKHKMG